MSELKVNTISEVTGANGVVIDSTKLKDGGVIIADAGNIGSASDTDALAISSGGVVTFTQKPVINSGVAIDNITIDGTEIDLSSGDLTIDVAGDIILDADGADVKISDGGTHVGTLSNSSSDFVITSAVQDKDIIFKGDDNGSGITALTLDMSDAGTAVFNHDVKLSSDAVIIHFGADSEITLTHDADAGLKLKHTATADDKPVILTLQTGETDMAADDVIGALRFQAPDEGTGTDAILVAAGIQAVAEGDFSSSSNATRLEFHTGASEAASSKMKLTSAGHLGVKTGTNEPGGDFEVKMASNVRFVVDDTQDSQVTLKAIQDAGTKNAMRIVVDNLNIETNTGNNTPVNRLTIASGGEVSVNDDETATGSNVFKVKGALNNTVAIFDHRNTSGSEELFRFRDGDVQTCGSIDISPGSNTVSFATSSDYRLKQSEEDITDGITKVKQLKPYRFNWKSNPSGDKVDGFFAHEVAPIVPMAIRNDKDETQTLKNVVLRANGEVYDDNIEEERWVRGKETGIFASDTTWVAEKTGVPKYQVIDQAKLVPLLTAGLKEAITKIETLETKVKALEDA